MTDNIRRFKFKATEQVPADSPDASHLPSTHDADPGISAEIAVERGEATPEQEAFVEQLKAERPLAVETDEKVEVEVSADTEPGKAIAYVVPDDALLLANPDGSYTQVESAVPDPTRRK